MLTDAFDILRNTASCGDTTGCKLEIVEQDNNLPPSPLRPTQRLRPQKHCLANLSPDMEERFKARFSRFADPLSANALARELCEHHEWIQQSKSNDGKRAWFDRVGPDTIYMRTNYRISKPPEVNDGFVHEYRTKPILRFYRDLI